MIAAIERIRSGPTSCGSDCIPYKHVNVLCVCVYVWTILFSDSFFSSGWLMGLLMLYKCAKTLLCAFSLHSISECASENRSVLFAFTLFRISHREYQFIFVHIISYLVTEAWRYAIVWMCGPKPTIRPCMSLVHTHTHMHTRHFSTQKVCDLWVCASQFFCHFLLLFPLFLFFVHCSTRRERKKIQWNLWLLSPGSK